MSETQESQATESKAGSFGTKNKKGGRKRINDRISFFWNPKEGDSLGGKHLGYKTIKDQRVMLIEIDEQTIVGVNESAQLRNLDDMIDSNIVLEYKGKTKQGRNEVKIFDIYDAA